MFCVCGAQALVTMGCLEGLDFHFDLRNHNDALFRRSQHESAPPPQLGLPMAPPKKCSRAVKNTYNADKNATAHCSVPMLKKCSGDEVRSSFRWCGAELATPSPHTAPPLARLWPLWPEAN